MKIVIRKSYRFNYNKLFDLMMQETGSYLRYTMKMMNLSEQEFRDIFRTTGKIYTIYYFCSFAGFFWIEKRDRIIHLHCIVIVSNYRRKGIANQVMYWIEKKYRNCAETIELGVYHSNTNAINLYKNLNYKIVYRLREYDFDIMQKKLSG